MSKTDRRVLKTKKSIRTAFLKLLNEKPLSSISVTELAKAADIDRRTFYLHYTCIDDIITEMENEVAGELNEYAAKHDFDISDLLRYLTEIMMRNADYYRYIVKDNVSNRFILRCRGILKNFISASFSASSDLAPDEFNVYTEYISSGIIGVYSEWLRTESAMELDELAALTRTAVSSAWDKIATHDDITIAR